jgi:hypothetical protein
MTEMMQTTEALPTEWTTVDEQFFRVVVNAFPPVFLAGAGVLLASYDDGTTGAESTPRSCGQPHLSRAGAVPTMVAEVSRPS